MASGFRRAEPRPVSRGLSRDRIHESSGATRTKRVVSVLLGGAAAVGAIHANFSLYRALGGDWLLDTVGLWAVDYVAQEPTKSALLLGTVVAIKSLIAVAPLLLRRQRWKSHRLLRAATAVCATVLTIYGGVNWVAAWLVLGGLLDTNGSMDRGAVIGHGVLWDPLFLAWGLLLGAALYASRRTRDS